MPLSRFVRQFLVIGALLALLPSPSSGSGRFAFRKVPPVPGFRIDSNGFRAANPTADTLRFVQPAKQWKAAEVSPFGATYLLGGSGRAPSKLRVNLLSPGFELHFQGGFGFSAGSNLSPFVTWSEGSVGAGVPTPKANWFIVSFQDSQPPLLLAFPGEKAAIRISGRPGAWRIDSIGVYRGWMRVALPKGTASVIATDAAGLGTLAKAVRDRADFWTAPAPTLVSREGRLEGDSLVVAWRFSRPFSMVPYPVLRAGKAGYRIEPLSKIVPLGIETDEGPMAYCAEPKLTIRFPRLAQGPGRPVVLGAPPRLATALSPTDAPRLFEYALVSRLAAASPGTLAQLRGLFADYQAVAPEQRDPASGRKFPFDGTGVGLELAAVYAAAGICLGEADNPMLADWEGAVDWLTWRPWVGGLPTIRLASSVVAVAGVAGHDPRGAVLGAMAEAFLVASGEKAFFEGLRRSLYRRLPEGMPEDRWAEALRSPWRSLGEPPLLAAEVSGGIQFTGTPGAEVAAREGTPAGSELAPAGAAEGGWSRFALKGPTALVPRPATPIPPAPRLPEYR